MAKEYRDQTGLSWERYDNLYCPQPSYYELLPQDHSGDIKTHILSLVDPQFEECEFRVVPLPTFSVPMWPISNDDDGVNCLHYSYCICFKCNQFCSGPAQICILLLICKYPDETFLFTKRAVIQCTVCNPEMISQSSYFGFILSAQHLISDPLSYGWDTFDPQVYDPERCYVCEQYECINAETCKRELQYICDNSIDGDPRVSPTAKQCMDNLLWHFFNYQLDIITAFVPSVCHNGNCRKNLRNRSVYMCEWCRRVMFCSERCLALHPSRNGCVHYLAVWLQVYDRTTIGDICTISS